MKKIVFKKTFGLIVLLGIMLFSAKNLSACDIKFEYVGEKKEAYSAGDIVILKVTVTLTHRNCPEALKKTKFEVDGLKILGATDWKETKRGVYERKMKLKVLETKNKKSTISATRTCDKEGGFGSLSIKTKAVNKS